MRNILLSFIWLFSLNLAFAQCEDVSLNVNISNDCLPLAIYDFEGQAPDGGTVEWTLDTQVSSAQLLVSNDNPFLASISMTEAGTYVVSMTVTLSDGSICEETFSKELFTVPAIQHTISSDPYQLCNNLVIPTFEIVNANDYQSVQWYINGDDFAGTSISPEFTSVQAYNVTIFAFDNQGCPTNAQQFLSIVEGPNSDNVSLTASVGPEAICLPEGSTYDLITNVDDGGFNATGIYWIDDQITTSTETTIQLTAGAEESQDYSFPVLLQFEGCDVAFTLEHTQTTAFEPSFTSDYDGIPLCDGEIITLLNTSHQLAWSDDFSWDIQGATIQAQTVNSIEFIYESEGDFAWTLSYNGLCSTVHSEENTVLIDVLEAVLADGLAHSACDIPYTLELAENSIIEDGTYSYSWSLSQFDSVPSFTSTEQSPEFDLVNLGSYLLIFEITNEETGCSSFLFEEDFFNLGSIEVEIVDEFENLCVPATWNTADFIITPEENQLTYVWFFQDVVDFTPNSFNFDGYSNEFTIDFASEYAVVLTVTNEEEGCSEVYVFPDTLRALAPAQEAFILLPDNFTICELPYALETDPGIEEPMYSGSYFWELEKDGQMIETSDLAYPNFEIIENGAYTLQLTRTNDETGCSDTAVISFTAQEVVLDFGEGPQAGCSPFAFSPQEYNNAGIEQEATYYWELTNQETAQVFSSTATSPSFTLTEGGLYDVYVQVTSESGVCTMDTLLEAYVQVYDFPEVSILSEDITLCELPEIIEVTTDAEAPSFGTLSYTWALNSNSTTIATSELESFNYNIQDVGNYTLSLDVVNDSTSCAVSDEIEISAEDLNLIMESPAPTQCQGSVFYPMNFIQNTLSASVNYTWKLTKPSGQVYWNTVQGNPSYVMNEAGFYDLEVLLSSDLNNCEKTITWEEYIFIQETPGLDLSSGDIDLCELPYEFTVVDNSDFDDDESENSFEWTLYEGLSEITSGTNEDFIYNFTESGNYTLEWTNIEGDLACTSSQEIEINVSDVAIAFQEEAIGAQCLGYNFAPQDFIISTIPSGAFYQWQVLDDDGNVYLSSTSPSPDFVLNDAGMYSLSVTLFSQINSCDFDTLLENYVEILPLDVLLNTSVSSCELPTTVQMSQNSIIPDGYPVSYLWTFYNTDGAVLGTSTEALPSFEYSQEGYYDISLTITNDSLGCVDDASTQDAVIIDIVEAILDTTTHVKSCSPFITVGSSINQTEELSNNYQYNWLLTNEQGVVYLNTNSENPLITVTESGLYDLQLIVNNPDVNCPDTTIVEGFLSLNDFDLNIEVLDDNNCYNDTDTIIKTIVVEEFVADLDFDYDISSFQWSVVPSAGTNIVSSSVDSVMMSFTEPGDYTVIYAVYLDDDECVYSSTVNFSLGVIADISIPDLICVGPDFSVSATAQIGIGSNTTYEWTSIEGLNFANSSALSTSISADSAGVYPITFTVVNDLGCIASITDSVEVYEAQASFSISDSIFQCSPALATLTSLENDYVTNYTWNIFEPGANFSAQTSIPTYDHVFSQYGYSDVELIIQTEHGCTDALTIDSVFLLNDYTLEIGAQDDNICFDGSESIDRTFAVDIFEPLFNFPGTITGFEWTISPSLGVTETFADSQQVQLNFTQADVYTLYYSVTLDDGDCVYEDEISFALGVLADIEIPETICVGLEFDLSATASMDIGSDSFFNWEASPEEGLTFTNPNVFNTGVIATAPGIYQVSFTATNDLGCFVTVTEELEVYEAIASFVSADTSLQCSPELIDFQSLENQYVSTYTWTIFEHLFSGEELVYTEQTDTSIFSHVFNEVANSDIQLIVETIHGCSDTLLQEDYIHVISPLPEFVIEPETGCDVLSVNIIDQSNLIDTYVFNPGNGELVNYVVGDTAVVNFVYPYGTTQDPYVEYVLSLHAVYLTCEAEFVDTVRVYPNPIINMSASETSGCPPFEISFEDDSYFAPEEESEFYWDFGDGSTSTENDPTYTYLEPGIYEIYHSVTSPNGCVTDTIWEVEIEIYQPPIAYFTAETPVFCFGQSMVQFDNQTEYFTSGISYLWQFGDGTLNFLENPLHYYTSAGQYNVSLQVTDANGCMDTHFDLIEIEILDSIVDQPILNYVTVEDNGILIQWDTVVDPYFAEISLWQNDENNPWEQIYASDSILPNQYFHDDVSLLVVNNYNIFQTDSCGYTGESELIHSTVLLSAESYSNQTITLSWTPYIGWGGVSLYQIYRSTNGLNFAFLDYVPGTELTYTDYPLCNHDYSYYVMAVHPIGTFSSRSNKVTEEPIFFDFSTSLNLIRSTVINNDRILTEWDTTLVSPLANFTIDRYDDYYGWIEAYAEVQSPPFIDDDVVVDFREYEYRVSYGDLCGNTGPLSNIGKNILLDVNHQTEYVQLNWTAYEEWPQGVEKYKVYYVQPWAAEITFVADVPGNQLSYIDEDVEKAETNANYCYMIAARSFDQEVYSHSNRACDVAGPFSYFPTAFSPNGDIRNDTYSYAGVFARSMNVQIYDRWGKMVFESDEVDFEWDGTANNTGKICKSGMYYLRYELEGFDDSYEEGDVMIFLLR